MIEITLNNSSVVDMSAIDRLRYIQHRKQNLLDKMYDKKISHSAHKEIMNTRGDLIIKDHALFNQIVETILVPNGYKSEDAVKKFCESNGIIYDELAHFLICRKHGVISV